MAMRHRDLMAKGILCQLNGQKSRDAVGRRLANVDEIVLHKQLIPPSFRAVSNGIAAQTAYIVLRKLNPICKDVRPQLVMLGITSSNGIPSSR